MLGEHSSHFLISVAQFGYAGLSWPVIVITTTSAALSGATWLHSSENTAVTLFCGPESGLRPLEPGRGCFCTHSALNPTGGRAQRPLASGAGDTKRGLMPLLRTRSAGSAAARERSLAPRRGRAAHSAAQGPCAQRPAGRVSGGCAGTERCASCRLPPLWGLLYSEALVFWSLWCLWAFASYFIMEGARPSASF